MSQSQTWVHRPPTGPVAWGAAVLVAPAVPLLSFFVLLAVVAVKPGGDNELPIVLSPVPWLLAGIVMARRALGRRARGVGFGLLAGSVATGALAVIASYGGWR